MKKCLSAPTNRQQPYKRCGQTLPWYGFFFLYIHLYTGMNGLWGFYEDDKMTVDSNCTEMEYSLRIASHYIACDLS